MIENEKEYIIEGRNAVREAIKTERDIDKIYIQKGKLEGSIRQIIYEAKKRKIVIMELTKEKMDSMSQTNKHQGIIARASMYEYSTIEDIVKRANDKGEPPFIIILDRVNDPHNLGAVIRTANSAGAHGVIIPKRRAVGITPTVVKASAGAIEYVPVAKVTNIANTIEDLKKEGIWVACVDMDGTTMYEQNLLGPIALVLGNEGEGVSRIVKEKCDFNIAIPMYGEIESLNVSVASAITMYEVVRQRRNG